MASNREYVSRLYNSLTVKRGSVRNEDESVIVQGCPAESVTITFIVTPFFPIHAIPDTYSVCKKANNNSHPSINYTIFNLNNCFVLQVDVKKSKTPSYAQWHGKYVQIASKLLTEWRNTYWPWWFTNTSLLYFSKVSNILFSAPSMIYKDRESRNESTIIDQIINRQTVLHWFDWALKPQSNWIWESNLVNFVRVKVEAIISDKS